MLKMQSEKLIFSFQELRDSIELHSSSQGVRNRITAFELDSEIYEFIHGNLISIFS